MASWTDHKRGRGVSLRAILLAVILIPFNALWIQSMVLIWGSGRPTSASLLFNAVFVLLVLALGNLALGRWAPRWAFEPGELVVVYVMLCLATALAGHDSLQVLVLMVAAFGYYASPANRWEELLGDRLPSSLIVTEPRAVRDFWEGGAYLYSWESLHPWLVPAALWIGFTVVLLGVMMCINILVWRRWNEQEKLTYPLIEIPFQLTSPGSQLLGKDLLGNKLLWLGLAVAASIDLLNGFAHLYPAVPSLHVTVTDLTPLIKTYPWRAMGQVAVGIYPFAIALGYLMPRDFLFSCWFFYWFWKAEMIGGYLIGQVQQTAFPYVTEQTFGAFAALGIFALWTGRSYFAGLVKDLLRGRAPPDQRRQVLPYQAAFGGLVVGLVILGLFATNLMGITVAAAALFLGGYLLIAFSITRMRAEFGLPVHGFWTGPLAVMVGIAGPRAMGSRNLIGLSLFFWLVRAQRSQPMPHGLEGLTLGERRGVASPRLLIAITAAIIVGTVAGFWSMVHLGYTHGFINSPALAGAVGSIGFNRTASWLTFPQAPHMGRLAGLVGGTVFTLALLVLRQRFIWWPFHPAGYATAVMMFMGLLWLPMLIAWVVKSLVLRYGGHKLYRRFIPFFLGVILGEFLVGTLWALIGTIGGFATYSFWPY